MLGHRLHDFKIPVIHIPFGEEEGNDFVPVINDEVEFKAVELPNRTKASFRNILKGFMLMDPAVMAHFQMRRIDKADAPTLT